MAAKCADQGIDSLPKEERLADLGRMAEEYQLAPLESGTGRPAKYWWMRAFVYAQEHHLEMPDIIQEAANLYLWPEARKEVQNRKYLQFEPTWDMEKKRHDTQTVNEFMAVIHRRKTLSGGGESLEDIAIDFANQEEEAHEGAILSWATLINTGDLTKDDLESLAAFLLKKKRTDLAEKLEGKGRLPKKEAMEAAKLLMARFPVLDSGTFQRKHSDLK